MVVYLVCMIQVNDPEIYSQYTARTPPTLKAHGGRFIARAGPVETFEGEPFKRRLVLLEFPSMEAVKEWHSSPEYQEVLQLRLASADANIVAIEGVSDTYAPDPKVVKTG